jgi:hypothetical protein
VIQQAGGHADLSIWSPLTQLQEDAAVAEAVRRFRQWEQEQLRPPASRDGGDETHDPVLGSIGAMRDAADELDEIVADAYRKRREETGRE